MQRKSFYLVADRSEKHLVGRRHQLLAVHVDGTSGPSGTCCDVITEPGHRRSVGSPTAGTQLRVSRVESRKSACITTAQGKHVATRSA